MSSLLERELDLLWSQTDIETVLGAHARLMAVANAEDLPVLVKALKSERNDFWTRELLAEPIAYLGGVDFLPELLDAFEMNFLDGHDNDNLAHFLTEIADQQPAACKARLEDLLNSPSFRHHDSAKWLLEFCK